MGKALRSGLAALGVWGTCCSLAAGCVGEDIILDFRSGIGGGDGAGCRDAGGGGGSAGDADTGAGGDSCDASDEGRR
jgi:hypothetical protein